MRPSMTAAAIAAWTLQCLAVASAAPTAASAPPTWEKTRVETMVEAAQPYRNGQFGFALPALRGTRAYRDAPPNPNHGVLFVLGEKRTISVAAEFDAADYGSTHAQMAK